MKHKWLWLTISTLLVATLACSLGGIGQPETEPVTDPGARPADPGTPAGDPSGTGDDALPSIRADALAEFNSYRSRWSWGIVWASGQTELMAVDMAETRNPAARHMSITSEGETIEWIQIGDTQWMRYGDEWIQAQMSPEEILNFGDSFMGPSDMEHWMSGATSSTYIGRETIHGFNTRHYTLDISPAEVALLSMGDVSDLRADVWIADQSGLPAFAVRYIMRWTGTFENEPGTAEWTYEVLEVNTPFTIEPPAGAAGAGLPEDIPAYPDPSEMFAMAGMVSFSVSDDVETVAEFYRQGMAAEGWSLTSDETFGETVMQSWSKGGRQADVIISTQDRRTSVMISLSDS